MKTCPNCKYIYNDGHYGGCDECGNPMAEVAGSNTGDLAFRYARQQQTAQREAAFERSAKSVQTPRGALDVYGNAPIADAVVEKALGLIVQREEVKYEEDDHGS